jgi:lipopolysaccharide/colanic/teichoic acid biosynthesis glycosyltransferase
MASTYTNPAAGRYGRPGMSGELRERPVAQRGARHDRSKAAMDLALALLLLIPAGVAIAVLTLLVRATSRGSGIYRQERVGKDGRRFIMFKIRTMAVNAESHTGPVWTQPNDARVTPLGRILRKLHLDELPQIFNVLRGEMSFVGPRPERPEFVRVLSEAIPQYRDRHAVRPGITGLAQIDLPPDTDLQSVRRKLVLDLDYIERGNLWLDTRLLLCTALRIVKIHEGVLTWILGLRRPEQLAVLEQTFEAQSSAQEATPETILLQAANVAASDRHLTMFPHREPNFVTSRKPR